MRLTGLVIGLVLICALALVDVLTAWSLLPVHVVVAAVVALLAGLVWAARSPVTKRHHLVFAGIAAACFVVHLVFAVVVGYEAKTWPRAAERKAGQALEGVGAAFREYARDIKQEARAAAGREGIVESLRSSDRLAGFAEARRIAARLERRYGTSGVAVRDASGAVVVWSGQLPNYLEDSLAAGPSSDIALRPSTAYYWLEAHAPAIGQAHGRDASALGWISVFRALDARYPSVLPGKFGRTLSEYLTLRVGHEVSIKLDEGGSAADADEIPAEISGEIAGEIRLPDGRRVGEAYVRPRSLQDEETRLKASGLFAVSIVIMAGILFALLALSRILIGARLSKASPRNLLVFVCMIWGARIGFALLRDLLHLGNLRVFTSYEYATQSPMGILRSPADLAITAVVAGFSLAVVVVALGRFWRSSRSGSARAAAADAVVCLPLGVIAGVFACGAAVVANLGLRQVFADASPNTFMVTPFDLGATGAAMKIGISVLTGTCLLLGSALVAVEVSLISRAGLRARSGRARISGVILAACVLAALTAAAVLAGAGLSVGITAGLCFLGGLVALASAERKVTAGLLGVAVALALASSVVQYPHALADLYSKQRDTVESIAARMSARTDEWKLSMLEEALAQVADDAGVEARIAREAGRLDSEAMRLWATSILSRARVVCGVHIMDATNQEIGRFSLEDVGDLAEIEGAVRAARFGAEPVTFISPDLYVGIAPILTGGTYLGSVVISIPYRRNDLDGDLASRAGLKPTFLEALGSASAPENPFGGTCSASWIVDGRIAATTDKDFEIGSRVGSATDEHWVERRAGGMRHSSYLVPLGRQGEGMMLSFKLLSASERAVYFSAVVLANMMVALVITVIAGAVRIFRVLARRLRGLESARFRWSFAAKLALAFVAIAVVPTLILGTTSRGFLRARLVEVMESKAGESLNLTRLALERLVGGEASRLARNPILMDELREEPSILGLLVTNDFSATVVDSSGSALATFGDAFAPRAMLERAAAEGLGLTAFSAEGELLATSAAPIRDVISPGNVTGCAFASRVIDDALARRLAVDLAADITFFSGSRVAASSRQELFVSEIMPQDISSDAYVDCFLKGRGIHFTWQRVGNVDLVIGYSPLRGVDGKPVGAVSVPLVARKDEIGQRMEWTSTAISYLLAIVIGGIFVLGLVLARRIANPIRELTRGMLRVTSGDLGFTVPTPSDDEIGDLVTSFNRMTVALDKSRNALTERKRYIETIISNVGAGIISTDWRGRVQTFNSAAETILRVRARDVTNRDATSVLRKIGASDLASALDEVGTAGRVARREFGLPTATGAVITVRAVASVVRGPRQRVMGKVIVFEDVTDLIRSKKLVAWSEMARQVAHEIKNPLTPMKLSAQQILQARRDGAADFDRILEEGLATIADEIEALRRISVEFSQFSRMPERKTAATNVNELIDESLAQYQRVAGQGLTIVKTLDPSPPRLVLDRDETKRMFVNIIENAIQAMPGGGRLEVRSGVVRQHGVRARDRKPPERAGYRVSVASRPSYAGPLKDFVEVSFTDTGSGISPANSEKLFEPNFSTKTHGTGLGLAISKGTVDAYGGEIVIDSTEGVGTCVRIRLPLGGEPPTRQPRPRRRYSRRRRPPRRE